MSNNSRTFNDAFDDVSSKYGAPMGRRTTRNDFAVTDKLVAQKTAMVNGCYDRGGAYWGSGQTVWAVWEAGKFDDGIMYIRASCRATAIAKVKGM